METEEQKYYRQTELIMMIDSDLRWLSRDSISFKVIVDQNCNKTVALQKFSDWIINDSVYGLLQHSQGNHEAVSALDAIANVLKNDGDYLQWRLATRHAWLAWEHGIRISPIDEIAKQRGITISDIWGENFKQKEMWATAALRELCRLLIENGGRKVGVTYDTFELE